LVNSTPACSSAIVNVAIASAESFEALKLEVGHRGLRPRGGPPVVKPDFCYVASMIGDIENDLDVQVAVKDGAIIVTLPGTSYCVVYRKGADPWLEIRDDPNSPISKFIFRARAWITADEKARELGWIV